MPKFVYTAWADHDEAFSEEDHLVEDVRVYALDLTHNEGDFATATITVRNPRIGLLNPGRKRWLWISVRKDDDTIVPIFFGRIVGTPQDVAANTVVLTFLARPRNYAALKAALADTLRELPNYDPVFVSERDREDPDRVLEGYTLRYHIDRVTLAVTVSDIAAGEDGTVELGEGDIIKGSLREAHGVPLRSVSVEAKVQWEQRGVGTVDVTRKLLEAARAAGSPAHALTSYTGGGFQEKSPKKGDRIGSGWTVEDYTLRRGDGIWTPQRVTQIVMLNATIADFYLWTFRPMMVLRYDAARSREEVLTFRLETDVQAVLSEPEEDEEHEKISFASSDVGEPIDPADTANPDGTLPIGERHRRSYFHTDRGKRSLEYLIAVARQHLVASARAVEISVDVDFDKCLDLSCRKNVHLTDPHLPGGEATGKIIGYSLIAEGGQFIGRVRIGCMVGQGNTVTETAGDPSYAEAGYMQAGYQQMVGQTIMPFPGEVTYNAFADTPILDDGVDFDAMTADSVVEEMVVINGESDQEELLNAHVYSDVQGAMDALSEFFTEIDSRYVPLEKGPFSTPFEITCSKLMIPKTIDLEAAAA